MKLKYDLLTETMLNPFICYMSDIGDGPAGFNSNRVSGNSTRVAGGQTGPVRDAWNNPIKELEPARQNTNTNNNNNNNNTAGGNDDGIDAGDIDTIWSDIKAGKSDTNNNNSNNNNNNGNNNNGNNDKTVVDPKVQLQNYLKEAGLGELTFSDAEKAELAEGKFENFNNKVLGLIQNAHVKALSGAQTLIKDSVAKAVKDAMDGTKGYIAGQENVKALHAALPFTKDAAIGPVAQTVMQKFLDRGLSTEDAIEGVKRWSKKFVNLADPDRQVNGNRNSNYRGSGGNEGNNDADWISILSPTQGR